ncbi:MAG: putative peptidoglycan-binding domain-containing protein, partial [Leptotrichiaceae bacterium]|nr:putative peptidoglycan-binding domain-containing protein [Leptotrichiaceae bacterium]
NRKIGKAEEKKYKNIEEEARKKGYKGDMRNIPMEMIRDLYMEKYFYGNKLDKIVDYRIALSVCDWIVSKGINGVKKAQEALNILNGNNDLAVDGIIGKYTLEALNKADPEKFLKIYHNLEREYYNNIAEKYPEQKMFLKGWQNRIDRKENYIKNNTDEKNAGVIKNIASLKNEISSKIKMNLDEKEVKNITEMKVR